MVYFINIQNIQYTSVPREIHTISKRKKHQYTHLHIHCTYTSKIYPYSNNQHYSEPRIIQDINNDGGKKKEKKDDQLTIIYTHANHETRLGFIFIPPKKRYIALVVTVLLK